MASSREDELAASDDQVMEDPSEASEHDQDANEHLPSPVDVLDTIATISLHYPDWYVSSYEHRIS